MARFFDIRAPQPKSQPAPPPRRKNNGWAWFLFILAILIIIIVAIQIPNAKVTSNHQNSTPTSNQSNFELFDEGGQSNLTQTKVLTVRILNASGEDASAEKAKKLLTDAGLKIEQVGKSENLYEQTIIYYKKDHSADGDRTNNILKNAFQTKLQESENLGSTYDVLVIVGRK